MKKIVATHLALIIGSTMLIILIINTLIQRDDAIEHMQKNSSLVINQIDTVLKKNEQEILKKNEVRYLLSQMPVSAGMEYYVVEKEEFRIVGATDRTLVTHTIPDVLGKAVNKVMSGEVFTIDLETGKKFYYFEKTANYYIGISQPEEIVFENVKSNMGQLFVYLFIAAYIMIVVSMKSIDKYIIKEVNQMVDGVQKITNGELKTKIEVENTPELKSLSHNINQMTESLLGQAGKISRILNAVDMLLAVYEYGSESDKVLVSGKLGAVLMMSEEETQRLIEDKQQFEQKIDEIKQCPVEGFKHVYQLNVETECYLKIESFENQKTEFGIIMDVTEEMIEKQRLQKERDYDLLTGLLTRRAFYQKMNTLYREPGKIGHAVLIMCDLDGLKQFNDTFGHANGDKAIQKAAEILASVKARNRYISRLSGDEFAMFIYGESSDEILQMKIRELYDYMMQAEIRIFNQDVQVRLSGGYVFYSKYPEALDVLLKKADRGLYDSKENGRARFTEYKET